MQKPFLASLRGHLQRRSASSLQALFLIFCVSLASSGLLHLPAYAGTYSTATITGGTWTTTTSGAQQSGSDQNGAGSAQPGPAQAHAGMDKAAIDALMAQLKAEEEDTNAFANKGDALMKKKDYVDAAREYQQALQTPLGPGYILYAKLANAYAQQGNIAQALNYYRIAASPRGLSNVTIMMRYAIRSCLAGLWAEAVKAYDEVLPWTDSDTDVRAMMSVPFDPNTPDPTRLLRNAQFAIAEDPRIDGFDQEALDDFNAAIKIDPLNPVINYSFAETLLNAGRVAEARPHYEIAAKYGDGKVKAHAEDLLRREYSEQPAISSH